ncbi:S-layer homology domain-containing protein [Sporobacter termitidis]|nr:S-layer homology domain-containing protein [Sporobacter termitidis]
MLLSIAPLQLVATAAAPAQITVSNSLTPVNGALDVTITGAKSPTSKTDWVGLYEVNEAPGGGKVSIWYAYLLDLGVTDGNGSFTFNPAKISADQKSRYMEGRQYQFIIAYDDSYTVEASVTFTTAASQVPAITSFAPENVTTSAGEAPAMPSTVTANYSDGTSAAVSVSWDSIAPAQYAQAGRFTVKGSVDSTGVVPKAGVTVNEGSGPLLSFDVISDTHMRSTSSTDIYNQHLTGALADLHSVHPDSDVLIINGDLTDGGQSAQYDQLNAILGSAAHPPIYFSAGNHDIFNYSDFDAAKNMFMTKTGMTNNYYDFWLKEYHFIVLGSDEVAGNTAVISDAQMDWLKTALSDGASPGKPIFVFLHQPLSNTVSGSDAMQDVRPDAQMKNIFSQYPQAILFTGHTHSIFNEPTEFYSAQSCNMVNVPSTAYLWYDPTYSQPGLGSQGLSVDVYADKVIIDGREFTRQEWLGQGSFDYDGGAYQTAPPVPTGLTAAASSSSQVNLSWNSSAGATGYDLMIDGDIVSDAYSPYVQSGLPGNSTHTYQVRAKNDAGTSNWSAQVSATTLGQFSLTSDKSSYLVGEDITVDFANGPGNPDDWVGVYKINDTPGTGAGTSTSTIWNYVNGTQTATTGISSGSITFRGGLSKPGEYKITFLLDGLYTQLGDYVYITVTAPSGDASLTSVASNASTAASGAGTLADPIQWAISVDGSKSALALSDIAVAAGARLKLYTDAAFSNEITGTDTLPLTAGGTTTAYIKVTAQNETTVKYYAVAITRAAGDTAPTITGVSPSSGSKDGGTSVTITGAGFTGVIAVKFGGTNASTYTVNSSAQIIAVSPAGPVGAVDITVTTGSGTSEASAADRFTYVNAVPPTVTDVVVTPATATVQKGGTRAFTARVVGENDPGQTVIWSVSGNSSNATAIAGSGVLTVASAETAATLTVTATSTADDTKSGSASVTVTVPPIGPGPAAGGGNTPAYGSDVTKGNGTTVTIPVTVDKGSGSAAIDITSQDKLISGGGSSHISIPSIPNVTTYTLGIPVSELSTPEQKGTLTVDTDKGSITVPSNMLAGTTGTNGSKAVISIGASDKSGLPDEARAAVGTRPLVQLSMTIDGTQTEWKNPAAPVTVSIPYAPAADELNNPGGIIVWYIDGGGKLASIPNGHYDPAAGAVTFSTTHFSLYAVGYNKVTFNDVSVGAWYDNAVSFIAARDITTGTGDGHFSPDAKLARADFLVMLMKAYGIAPDANPTDNFSDAGDTYYTGYLAAAKRLGITSGVGNGLFAPAQEITREQMFTLLCNALRAIGRLPQGNTGKTLTDFSDANLVASWARDAMAALVASGTVSGNNGALNPTGTTTRAEMAQVLYNLLSK